MGEFVSRFIELEDERFDYTVYVPDGYTADKQWPAIVFLHGMDERGIDNVKQTYQGIGKYIRVFPERYPCIVIMPQVRREWGWKYPQGSDLVLGCLDQCMGEYSIDPNRVVLTGLSMGGFGAWRIGALHADRFCAVVPICGGGDPSTASALKDMPIRAFHGIDDKVVPVDCSREMVEAVQAVRGTIRYTEYPWVTHNSWDPAYGDLELTQWMLAQSKG